MAVHEQTSGGGVTSLGKWWPFSSHLKLFSNDQQKVGNIVMVYKRFPILLQAILQLYILSQFDALGFTWGKYIFFFLYGCFQDGSRQN